MKRYSRLASVEQKRNVRSAYLYVVMSIVAIILLVFLGIPLLVRFAGFVGTVGKSNKPVEINDITPPAPPKFEDVPEHTNDESLELTGVSENGAIITLTANGDSSEVVANSEGRFNFTFNLDDGENEIFAVAKDTSGNESNQTKTYTISFDNTEPKLEVTSPTDGAAFYGAGQKQLQITGSVDEKVHLTINERLVTQKDDGTFTFTTSLNEGTNSFEVKAVDPANNEASTSFSVTFNP